MLVTFAATYNGGKNINCYQIELLNHIIRFTKIKWFFNRTKHIYFWYRQWLNSNSDKFESKKTTAESRKDKETLIIWQSVIGLSSESALIQYCPNLSWTYLSTKVALWRQHRTDCMFLQSLWFTVWLWHSSSQ